MLSSQGYRQLNEYSIRSKGSYLIIDNIDIFSIFFCVLSILKSWTYIRQSGSDQAKTIAEVLIIISLSIVIFLALQYGAFRISNIKWCVFPIFYATIRTIYRYDRSIDIEDSGITVIGLVCVYLVLAKEYKSRVYETLRCFFVALALVGIIIYLAYIFSLPIPYQMVRYYAYRTQPKAMYADYLGMVLFISGTGDIRLCGPFNEPGLFGTFLGLLVISDDVNLKKIGNIIMILAGVMTFSLAFVYLVTGWLIYKNSKNWRVVFVLLIGLVVVAAIPYIRFDNRSFELFFRRIVKFVDNRTTESFNHFFKKFIRTPKIWFGIGGGYNAIGVLSIKLFLVEYGLIGLAIYVLYIVRLGMYNARKNINALFYIALFILSMYQRPDVLSPVYMVLLVSGTENILKIRGIQMNEV